MAEYLRVHGAICGQTLRSKHGRARHNKIVVPPQYLCYLRWVDESLTKPWPPGGRTPSIRPEMPIDENGITKKQTCLRIGSEHLDSGGEEAGHHEVVRRTEINIMPTRFI